MLFCLLKYRRKVVSANLGLAFPSHSREKRIVLEKQFYKYLSDVFVETIKGFTLTEEEIRQRITFGEFPELTDSNGKAKSCILLIGHLGNQELIAKCLPFIVHAEVKIPFRKIKPLLLEEWVNESRSQFGSVLFPAEKSAFFLRKDTRPFVLALAADQAASPAKSFWLPFFGRETTFFRGPEKWANWLDCPVVYAHVTRPKRGCYALDFELITSNPKSFDSTELTQKYAELLEENIRKEPSIWLWSHRRWKHTKL
ncbi:MAG: lysophospholipid acyltransferase family protein [Spirosomataceae bacterium]